MFLCSDSKGGDMTRKEMTHNKLRVILDTYSKANPKESTVMQSTMMKGGNQWMSLHSVSLPRDFTS